MSFGGQLNGKKQQLVFIEAEDSAEGPVKVATREKVYKLNSEYANCSALSLKEAKVVGPL